MSIYIPGVLHDSDEEDVVDRTGGEFLEQDDILGSSWNSDTPSSTSESLSWIGWWCSHHGHEYFCEVPEEFIEDEFNLTGLPDVVRHYKEAYELILDLEPDDEDDALNQSAAEQSTIESDAELLYGLIHQRFIISRVGLAAMAEKYEAGHFGVCPRILCDRTPVLPVGLSDTPRDEPVKLYCPTCLDVYTPPNSRFHNVDGAFFGTTFPHLFFMTFPELVKPVACTPFEPRIYGFRVSTKARTGPKMAFLRHYIGQLPEGSDLGSADLEEDDADNAANPENNGGGDDGKNDGVVYSPPPTTGGASTERGTRGNGGLDTTTTTQQQQQQQQQQRRRVQDEAQPQPDEVGNGAEEDIDVRGARNGDDVDMESVTGRHVR